MQRPALSSTRVAAQPGPPHAGALSGGERPYRSAGGPLRLAPLLVLVGAVAKLPETVLPPGTDQGIFATYGRLMLQGGRPYVAFWDVHPPLVFLYWMMVQRLAGLDWARGCGATWGPFVPQSCASLLANVLDLLLTVVCGLLVYVTARQAGGTTGVGWLAAVLTVYFANSSMLSVGGSVPAKLALTPAVLAVWSYLRARSGGGWGWPLLSGAAAVVAVLTKQPALLTLGWLAALAMWQAPRSPTGWRLLSGYVLGAAALTAGVCLWLGAVGSLGDFVDQAWAYNAVRVVSGNWHAAAEGLTAPSVFRLDGVIRDAMALLFVGAFAGALAIVLGRARREQRIILGWALVNLAAIVGFREFVQVVPGLALLAAFGIGRLWRAAERDGLGLGRPVAGRLALVVMLGTVFCLSSGFQVGQLRRAWYERGPGSPPAAAEVVAARVADTPPGPLFVWGNAGQLYPLSGRDPASRFINAEAVRLTAPGHERHRAELLTDLAQRPPSALVLAPHLDEPELRVDGFPELRRLLDACYQVLALEPSVGRDWGVYARRPDAGDCR